MCPQADTEKNPELESLKEDARNIRKLKKDLKVKAGKVFSNKSLDLEQRWSMYENQGYELSLYLSSTDKFLSKFNLSKFIPAKYSTNPKRYIFEYLDYSIGDVVNVVELFDILENEEIPGVTTEELKEELLAANVYSFIVSY